jgi:hypothetical protein
MTQQQENRLEYLMSVEFLTPWEDAEYVQLLRLSSEAREIEEKEKAEALFYSA